jgi:hypothetical protein
MPFLRSTRSTRWFNRWRFIRQTFRRNSIVR